VGTVLTISKAKGRGYLPERDWPACRYLPPSSSAEFACHSVRNSANMGFKGHFAKGSAFRKVAWPRICHSAPVEMARFRLQTLGSTQRRANAMSYQFSCVASAAMKSAEEGRLIEMIDQRQARRLFQGILAALLVVLGPAAAHAEILVAQTSMAPSTYGGATCSVDFNGDGPGARHFRLRRLIPTCECTCLLK
jgi:hypothetical protein